jgi:putative ABC transport system permease protein
MIRVALKGLAERRLRTILTALAVVIGVAMVSGAYVLSDTMGKGASSLSTASYKGTDAVVTARTAFHVSAQDGAEAPGVSASLLGRVRQLPQVAVAVGDITDKSTKLVGRDGKIVGSGPYVGVGHDSRTPGASRLAPFRLRSGRWPTGPGEVVIDAGGARQQHWRAGDRVRVQAHGPAHAYRISGIATFGAVRSLGTASFTVFDLATAQHVLDRPGSYDSILVGARPGVSAAQLRRALSAAVPHSARVLSAAAQDRFGLDGLKQFVKLLEVILLAFGGVAIFLGSFTIFNTLSITVAQRSRELALLRTIGSSRRQVLGSVVLEALIMGILASATGLFVGLGLATGLSAIMAKAGLDLPQTGTVFATRTAIVSLLVGVLVTVLAGLGPALRATRVAPVTALREGAEIPPSRLGRRAPRIATGMLALAAVLLGVGMFAHGITGSRRLVAIVPGCLLLFVGVAIISPRLVRPLASLLGRPAERIGGAAGSLARGNSMRNPGRTAVTAAALMIGIALVTFVTVLGQGIRASTTGTLEKQIRADYVISGQDGYSPIDPAASRAAATAPEAKLSSSITQSEGRAFGQPISVNGVQPQTIGRLYRFDWKAGSDAALARLDDDGAIVDSSFATKHHLRLESRFAVTPPNDGRLELVVRGIDSPPKFNALGLGDVSVSSHTFARTFTARQTRLTFIKADGAGAKPALERALAAYPDVKVASRSQFANDQITWVSKMLAILYVLLGLAVIVSLFGIINTLVLSVFERTRELGMLRAIGMSRRQVRRMIRHESIITSLIGATMGIALGVFLAILVTTALASQGLRFALPVGSLASFAIVAIAAGSLAAILPARRAARLDPLTALQYE